MIPLKRSQITRLELCVHVSKKTLTGTVITAAYISFVEINPVNNKHIFRRTRTLGYNKSIMYVMSETELKLKAMENGDRIDVSLTGEPAPRLMSKAGESTYAVYSFEDGHESYFSYKATREVLDGKRLPWSGDLTVKQWLDREL